MSYIAALLQPVNCLEFFISWLAFVYVRVVGCSGTCQNVLL